MTLVGRLPENGVLVGLPIYEYIDPRQGAVRCGDENPIRAFNNSRENLNFANPKSCNSGF